MGPVAEFAAEQVAADVIQEAIDEVVGRSHKKWAVILIAVIVGAAIASAVHRRRQAQVQVLIEEP